MKRVSIHSASIRLAVPFSFVFFALFFASSSLRAQSPPRAVTVPVTLDHNRIVIDVYLPLKDGTTKRVRGLVDTASTQVMLSKRAVSLAGGGATCDALGEPCSAIGPASLMIGELKIPLNTHAVMVQRRQEWWDVMIPGMSPEVVIPTTALQSWDVVIDYANRQFTIGPPGSVKFAGSRIPMKVASDGKVSLVATVDGRPRDFVLDTGLPASLLDAAQFASWRQNHPNWPFVAGSLNGENITGAPEELQREMLRVPSLQLGSATLPDVLFGSNQAKDGVRDRIGGEAFKGARLGIDYAHSALYIEQISNPAITAGLDVVGLTLRPEVDGRYTVMAIVPYEGQPSVPDVKTGDILLGVAGAPVTGATMGQVWSLLGGEPGQVRELVIERDGKRMTVEAVVRRFMSAQR